MSIYTIEVCLSTYDKHTSILLINYQYNSAKKIIANPHSTTPYVVFIFTTKKAIPSEDGIA